MSKVFVTGATGFLGRHLCEALVAKGDAVTALVRDRGAAAARGLPEGVALRQGDLLEGALRAIPPETEFIYHLAAKTSAVGSQADPVGVFDLNARSTVRLLEEVRTRGLALERFTVASTSLVYAPSPSAPVSEESATLPASPYAASKLAAEAHARACDLLYGIPTTVIRVFNGYGPHQSPEFVVPSILGQCLGGAQLRLGNLWPVRDFVFAADVVDLFLKASASPRGRGEVFNAGSGVGTSVEALARLALRVTGSSARLRVDRRRARAKDTAHLVADVSKARRLLSWKPRVGLEAGLRLTAASLGAP